MGYLFAAFGGYLMGCSNMALYLSKLKKVDLRSAGSGNLGASNAVILMGWGAGVLTAIHDIGKACAKLMEMTNHDAVGINYDHGNIILNKAGETIDQVFELLPEKIYYAHLKNLLLSGLPDGNRTYTGVRLSDGHINQYTVMQYLKKHLKTGIVAIEYPSSGDGVIAAIKDMEYIRFLKSELNIQ